MGRRKLRTGYTTGACAAAAAKAAVLALAGTFPEKVEIPFPDGKRRTLPVHRIWRRDETAGASVIKDAGDDPDVTNGVEVVVTVERQSRKHGRILLRGGEGVGRVTKPGLPVPVGEPAINPVPRRMIREAIQEALSGKPWSLIVTVSIPGGERIAEKTLNPRLGIVGGLSILGTTGIVKPLSSEAWLATIESSLSVARAAGHRRVVLSFGRASEVAHMKHYGLPEELYILMGDFVEFALRRVRDFGFREVWLCGQWAKLLKCASVADSPPRVREPYGFTTHVRHGVLRGPETVALLKQWGFRGLFPRRERFNTAREVFLSLETRPIRAREAVFREVLRRVRRLALHFAGNLKVRVTLVNYRREVIFEL
ncbi:cobalt-precorrin-5B (C(1))-methyltransferase CbiD [Thermosulfurimonas sp. F29]|uniref:cobalt-precorrin-5B (C(1))-methyltransferase CbiD n=1 Tax=Thermosulfurimonas sp. F29 TaxID=2867247 RepID=UPI001C833355|nr:cobalt-precorrin-5B (C(1))-methyltransferase CbiD [Thermosulfurimonas sp. F29]MBX6423703.1 cobalt-precorrin-5B (C(1))-methyltransferase CbiD [Thermosulfurimonas sp. F29]